MIKRLLEINIASTMFSLMNASNSSTLYLFPIHKQNTLATSFSQDYFASKLLYATVGRSARFGLSVSKADTGIYMRTPEAYAAQKGLWGEQCSLGFFMDGDKLEGKMQVARAWSGC
jgi:hypothetical protein